jgi:hypothetical protein
MTPIRRDLLEDLTRLTLEIEPLLDLVSAAARAEWRETRSRLRTAGTLESGSIGIGGEALAVMHAKVRRFRDILFAMAAGGSRSTSPMSRGDGNPCGPLEKADAIGSARESRLRRAPLTRVPHID